MNEVVLFGDSPMGFSRPLSIYLLATHLRKHGITTKPIWGWKYVDTKIFEWLCKKFISVDTKVVGISSTLLADSGNNSNFFGIDLLVFEQRIQLIRSLAPDCQIVVGGSQTTYSNLSVLQERNLIDLFVTGQGEQVLLEIVQAVKNNSRVRTSSLSPAVTSDKLYPYNEFVRSGAEYSINDCIVPGESIPLEFARGCIFKCSFCSYELNGKKPGDYIKHADTLRNELIKNYETQGIQQYIITDDLINDSEQKVDQILEIAQTLPFKLTYTGYVRLDLLRRFPSMAAKLKESGLIGAFFGIETINDASGRAVGKGLGRERTSEALEICDQAWNNSVAGLGGFILGLPHDTPDTKHELVEWLTQPMVKRVLKDVLVKPLFLSPDIGMSDIDRDPAKFGYTYNKLADGQSRYLTGHPDWQLSNYDFSQARKDSEFVQTEFYRTNKYQRRLEPFSMPYIMSLSDCPDEVLNVVLNDHSTMWTDNTQWDNYLNTLVKSHRTQYLAKLLRST
jgi:radical SAM superfamily enzyme YgiQ (UPF0313 family)